MSGLKVLADKVCPRCRGSFNRHRNPMGRLEDVAIFKRRKYCSLHCANQRERPKHWETYHWRARQHRKQMCEACRATTQLHAHHVDGNPQNNEPTNIQTLCVHCHNFLHATAARRGRTEPGRMPCLVSETESLTGWTDSKPLATDKYQQWRQQHGNY